LVGRTGTADGFHPTPGAQEHTTNGLAMAEPGVFRVVNNFVARLDEGEKKRPPEL
jgi:hypothetical protein